MARPAYGTKVKFDRGAHPEKFFQEPVASPLWHNLLGIVRHQIRRAFLKTGNTGFYDQRHAIEAPHG
jgi:hypothetical protein